MTNNDGNSTNLGGGWVLTSRWLSFAMLVLLHLALWLDIQHPWGRAILLAHLGVFMVWQPLWRGETKLSVKHVVGILTVSLVALIWLNWWVLAFWLGGLFSLVGGRVFAFSSRWQRMYYLLMMAYLLAVLLLFVAPQMFGIPMFEETAHGVLSLVLLIPLLVMAALPVESESSNETQAVDFFYVLLLFLLLALLVLGSLASMMLGHLSYFPALLRTLTILAVALFALGILWSPRMGFAGLQTSFSRYVLSIGTPLEEWLKKIAAAAKQEHTPVAFIERATAYLVEMPSIVGMAWLCEEGHGNLGVSSLHRVELVEEDLVLTLFSRQAISPTVLLHMRLLAQVLGHFYQAKRREQHLREITRQQTIYETGARLTHDLKNMLQSLFALTSVAQHDAVKAQPILKNQLPILTQRIESLLTKLKAPGEGDEESLVPLENWWEGVRQRHQHRGVEWIWEGGSGEEQAAMRPNCKLIPAPLFDCVLDNLFENACNKRLSEPHIRIEVHLKPEPLHIEIIDTGSAVPDNIARNLLRTVVPSENGLGVGMYQAARWAQQLGYRLSLKSNRAGSVIFEFVAANN